MPVARLSEPAAFGCSLRIESASLNASRANQAPNFPAGSYRSRLANARMCAARTASSAEWSSTRMLRAIR